MECTTNLPSNDPCPNEATHVIAWPQLQGRAMFVAPYCADHAADIECDMGGVPAAGPALDEACVPIEGIHS